MAIIKRGENVYLVRVYLCRDSITNKRIEINKTVHGSREEAEKQERLLKDKAEEGQVTKSPRMTVKQLVEFYLESTHGRRGEARQVKLTYIFKKYVVPYIGDRQISRITMHDLQSLFDYLLEPKKEKKTDDGNK